MTRPRQSYRTRAWSMVGSAFVGCIAGYIFIGLHPGPVLAFAFALVMATLLLGRTVMITMLVLTAAVTLGLGIALETGLWAGPLEPDEHASSIWVREALIATVAWAGLGFLVTFVVNTIERTSGRRKAALEEKEEALERLGSESKARREAEAIAAHAQKVDALGKFAAGVAHDFNNALCVVKGWTEILGDSESQEHTDQALEAINQATGQAEQLARQLLIFGRKDVRTPRYLRLDDVIDNAGRTLTSIVPARISLNMDLGSNGAAVFADETQIQQLLFNLVINARDAVTAEGAIHVRTFTVDDAEAEGGLSWAMLEVEDNGIGMDEETRSQAFEPFFSTKEAHGGTGLGLSTVFTIVDQSNGSVELDSAPGKGTRATISLRRVELAAKDQVENVHQRTHVVQRRVRVLVLEDDPLAREFIIFSLERHGWDVLSAANGTDALALIAEAGPSVDILCTDTVFPHAPLREVIEAFESAAPEGSVVICSGYVPEELTIQGVEAGVYDFLAKTFSGRELVEKIESILRLS